MKSLILMSLTGVVLLGLATPAINADEVTAIGTRRELFVDTHLIQAISGQAALQLHSPVKREVALTFDAPWEGNASGYPTVIHDGDRYRMYYRGNDYLMTDAPLRMAHSEVVCYAESTDGIHWVKPDLGLYDWPGVATNNNIIWPGSPESHNFAPFIDTNPACPTEARYKAVAGTVTTKGLLAFHSADGVHWTKISDEPVVTKGAFDSHNTAFWDADQQRYIMYLRDFIEGRRHISMAWSKDFREWSEPVPIEFPDSPPQGMYTNQIAPYYRAPHILLGFPTRYVVRAMNPHVRALEPIAVREKIFEISDPRVGTDLTDGAFISGRDGLHFKRWNEAFLRPGPEGEGRWIYGDNYQVYGLWETKSDCVACPNEISMAFNEGAWREGQVLRRYTIRLDGFVSLNATYEGGECLTKPLRFEGSALRVNYATSAAGSLRVELRDGAGTPIPGFTLAEAVELYGDSTEQLVSWANGADLSALSGTPVSIRFVLKDGDLYAYHFE